MSAPSCRPRLVRAMSSACAAATASSKNNSKKSPIRKNNRQPGFASFISRYCAMTGEGAGGEWSFIGEGRPLRVFDGSIRARPSTKERIGMAESSPSFPVIREAVASFPDRDHFHRAVSNLLAAGFDTADLSVLASHDSLAAAGEPPASEPRLLPAGLADEIKYIAPMTVAGIILLSGGSS